jgi:hypothetical protein
MLQRIEERLTWREPLQHYEIFTPLTVEQCLMRLTGQHPPFRGRERLARSHPFKGEIREQSISIKAGRDREPYEITGELVESACGTRFQLDLSIVDRQVWEPMGLLLLWFNVAAWCIFIPMTRGLEPSYSVAAALVIALSFPTLWAMRYVLGLCRRASKVWLERIPDVSDTLEVLANLVLATSVEGVANARLREGGEAFHRQGTTA